MKAPRKRYTFVTMDKDTLTFTAPATRVVVYAIAVKLKGEEPMMVGTSHSWRGAEQVQRGWWRLPTIEKSYIGPAEEV